MVVGLWPDQTTHPAGPTGAQLAALQKTEGDAIWDRVIRPVGSVAGTANAITGVCSPPLTADPADGQTFVLTPGANNTGAVTVNLDVRGAIALVDVDGNALVADDLVSGRPITFRRQGASGSFRLTQPTQRALVAALATNVAAGMTGWEQFGDTTIGAAVSQVEHTFTAGAYSAVLMVFSGMSPNSNTVQFTISLRNASGAVVSLLSNGWNGGSPANFSSADVLSGQARFNIDSVTSGSTKTHYGELAGGGFDNASTNSARVIAPISSAGANATAPDRIRVAFGTGTIDAGRIMSYGLKV